MALALVIAGAAVVIWRIHFSRHPVDAATIVGGYIATLTLASAVAAPLIAWWRKGFSAKALRRSTPEQLNAAANVLAEQVADRWRLEATRRRIVTPTPIPVEWRWAGDALAPSKLEVVERPPPGLGVSVLPNFSQLANVPDSGVVTGLHDELYAQLPYGRLVILGAPGAGKTAAMILLLLAALDRRRAMPEPERSQVPVPVWLSLGGWNPEKSTFRSWAIATVNRDYPALRAPEYGPSPARDLLHTCRISLFLDGLDELPEATRTQALRSISEYGHGLRVVLTSRSSEYRHAVLAALGRAAVIQLRPVQLTAAASYLLREQPGPSRFLWSEVTDFITEEPDSILAQVLGNPFAVSLVRDCFADTDPTILIDQRRFPTVKAIHDYLITRLLITSYPDDHERRHAVKWLTWLACRMNSHRDLVWWHISEWLPQSQVRFVRGTISGLALMLGIVIGGALSSQFVAGIEFGGIAGLAMGCVVAFKPRAEAPRFIALDLARIRRLREVGLAPPVSVRRGSAVLGLAIGVPVAVIVTFSSHTEGRHALTVIGHIELLLIGFLIMSSLVTIGAFIVGSAISWILRLAITPITNAPSVTAAETYRADRNVSLILGVTAVALCMGFLLIFAGGPSLTQVIVAAGLGAAIGFGSGSVPTLKSAELILAFRGVGVVRFGRLLQCAYDRQVLRQAGAIYQFRHNVIQDQLAVIPDRDKAAELQGRETSAIPATASDVL